MYVLKFAAIHVFEFIVQHDMARKLYIIKGQASLPVI